jgi:tetratricopeptide (TPR) repeat protein
LQPLHPAGYSRRADDLLQMNRFEEGLSDIAAAIALAPMDGNLHRTRGRIYRAMSDLPAAMTAFDRAVELDPKSFAHSERANTAAELRRDREFLESSRKMTELMPKTASWLHSLAVGYLLTDPPFYDLDAAKEAAEHAVRILPGNPYYRTLLGYVLYKSGHHEEAVKEFAESRRLKPAPVYDAPNLFGLALCAQKAGNLPKAREWFGQGIIYKDTGKLQSVMAERIHDRIYAEAAKALGLPQQQK